jgi:hypothetical protein
MFVAARGPVSPLIYTPRSRNYTPLVLRNFRSTLLYVQSGLLGYQRRHHKQFTQNANRNVLLLKSSLVSLNFTWAKLCCSSVISSCLLPGFASLDISYTHFGGEGMEFSYLMRILNTSPPSTEFSQQVMNSCCNN